MKKTRGCELIDHTEKKTRGCELIDRTEESETDADVLLCCVNEKRSLIFFLVSCHCKGECDHRRWCADNPIGYLSSIMSGMN